MKGDEKLLRIISSAGMLLLGLGVLIVALTWAHFYATIIWPESHESKDVLWVFCEEPAEGAYVLRIRADSNIENVTAVVGEKVCNFAEIPAGSSEICEFKANTSYAAYRVVAYADGKKMIKADLCRPTYPIARD